MQENNSLSMMATIVKPALLGATGGDAAAQHIVLPPE